MPTKFWQVIEVTIGSRLDAQPGMVTCNLPKRGEYLFETKRGIRWAERRAIMLASLDDLIEEPIVTGSQVLSR